MAKVSPLQNNFGSGEVSPLFSARVDVERYGTALATCKNYIPLSQGPLTRRPGTSFVANTKANAAERLIPFEFSTEQAYVLAFGVEYVRFYRNNGIVTLTPKTVTGATAANPVVITSNAHGLSNGDKVIVTGVSGMTEINNREFTLAGVTANTFQLSGINGSSFTAYASGGTVGKIFEISSPYAAGALSDLKYTQSADVLYVFHPDYRPRQYNRSSDTNWTTAPVDFADGPYLPMNSFAQTTLTLSGTTGNITITLNTVDGMNGGQGFVAGDVGRLIRIKHAANWGRAVITARVSSTVADATVQAVFGGSTASNEWRQGLYSAFTGYPATGTFHEDRLFLAGCPITPQRIDASETAAYTSFLPSNLIGGAVVDTHALSFSLNANDVNAIRWLSSDEKGLPIGTVGGEWIVRPSSQNEALTPTNITAKRASSYGSADIQPVQSGKATLYVQRAGRKIREMSYFYDADGFRAPNLTLLSEHITSSGLVQIAHQKEPQSIVWGVRKDGVLVGLTYERDSEDLKAGWHRHELGGVRGAGGSHSIVESIAVIPSADGTRDELWMIVQRYVNGAVVRHVEYLTKIFQNDEQEDAFFVDGGLTYDNPAVISGATTANPVVITATAHGFSNGDRVLTSEVVGMTNLNGNTYTIANQTANTFELSGVNGTAYVPYVSAGEVRKLISTVSGLSHLEGESVAILADGAVLPSATVSSGRITLSSSAAVVHVGYGYRSDGKTMRFEAGAADGTALGKTRRTHRLGMVVHRTLGLKIGTDFDSLDTVTFRRSSDAMTRAVPLFSGIISETISAGYDTENQICFRQDQPLPGTILAIMPQMVTQDR